ncbi:hypothetical protein PSECIP111854_03301 [Pseudoalteromonas sp. CIP111854]|uniref:Uncharacterized protein n=1 Tax=Pseudoalteromonas holothuriae TaxID=2963714 RepID=A0A9W4R2L8_9GAMM|nr:hypothetical protein PSECIP111854_03301 [Pseudoalteromonas sp. CIP111854]
MIIALGYQSPAVNAKLAIIKTITINLYDVL